MADRSMIVDGTDLGSIGFGVRAVRDHRSGSRRLYSGAAVPGRLGDLVLSGTPVYTGRLLIVDGLIDANTISSAHSVLDEIKYRLSDGVTEVQYVDDESRYYFGYYVGGRVQGLDPDLSTAVPPKWLTEVQVYCPDSRAFGAASTVTCSTSGTGVPMGSAPVRPVFQMDGALSGATVTIYAQTSTGGALSTFTVSNVTVGAGSWIRIDSENQTITTSSGANLIGSWASTVGSFVTLDPHDGDLPNSSWPRVRSGTGGKSVKVVYRKAYW